MFRPRTLSFWLAVGGASALGNRWTRKAGVVALMAVSWGALGGIYFRTAERYNCPVEPAWIMPRLDVDDWKSAAKHAVWMLPALEALRRM